MKIVEPNKDAVCFYTGFRPNNIVSIQKLEEQLLADGYTKGDDGKWKKFDKILDNVQVKVQVNEYAELIARY